MFRDDARHYKALLLGRNDGRSLLWCCNYVSNGDDPDGLGECDVRRMRDALLSREYEVAVVGQDCQSESDVLRALTQAARECAQSHHFLFYFSGHAVNEKDGFYLILAQDRYRERLPGDSLIRVLRQECSAASKLVILDCCYAEGVTEVWQPRRYDNLRFLVATRSLVRAKEIPGLKSGLFTYCLCDALTNPSHWVAGGPDALVAPDGHMFSDRLLRWLKQHVRDVMREHLPDATAFPEPTADGGQAEPFLIARVPTPPLSSTALETRNHVFRRLLTTSFREAFGDSDEPLRTIALSVIDDIDRREDSFVLSSFYIEDFFDNDIIRMYRRSLEEACQQRLPSFTEQMQKARDDALDQVEHHFYDFLSETTYSLFPRIFIASNIRATYSKD